MKHGSDHELLVVGGGPGGISAAIWARDLGLSAALIERSAELGGQLLSIHGTVLNYPGLEAANGREVRDSFKRSLSAFDVPILTGRLVTAIDSTGLVTLSDGSTLRGKAIILATGVRRRELGVRGEKEFRGRGILDSGALQRRECTGRTVAVIGGGDAALENAILISEFAERVFLVHRRRSFSARPEFVETARQRRNIEFLVDAEVEAFEGGETVESVVLSNGRRLSLDAALIRIGVVPNSELVSGIVQTDSRGYVDVDRDCRTTLPGLYAVGDVANPVSPTISTAAGMGATAAKSAFDLIRRQ